MTEASFRVGFAALIGRPNSGKSTLLNTLIGENLAIVSNMPQTTRKNMKGILNAPNLQVVFIDTPGIHEGRHKFNQSMLKQSVSTFDDTGIDTICYLVDLSREFGEEEDYIARKAILVKNKLTIVFNKADLCEDTLGRILEFYQRYPELKGARETMLSAIEPEAKEMFLDLIMPLIPYGTPLYEEDDMTDASMRHFAAEYIRGQIIHNAQEEVPHASYVEIISYKETPERHFIEAEIHVETQGQKAILIGKDASVIKKIRKFAERNMKNLIGIPVTFSLFVKVTPDWRNNASFLRHMGID